MDIRESYELASKGLEQYGLEIDEKVYNALWLATLAKRSFIISTTDVQAATAEVQCIFQHVWGIPVVIVNCETDPYFKEFVDKLMGAEELNTNEGIVHYWLSKLDGITIWNGIHSLKPKIQQRVLKLLRQNRNRSTSDLYTTVSIINKNEIEKIDKYLIDILWFCTFYEPPSDNVKLINHDENPSSFFKYEHTMEAIKKYRLREKKVTLVLEIKRYVYDIIIYLRVHRMVVCGVKTYVLNDLYDFVRFLAVIKGYDYVVPSMVKLAASKILPFKLTLVKNPEDEPTLLYGSDLKLIEEFVPKWDAEVVVEDVLNKVQPPI